MSPPVEAFEYDHLTEVYRKEQRTKNVSDVRKDLYVIIRQRLDELRRDSEREFAMDQFSTRAKLAANQLTKFQEKADQVFDFRMEKILAMALRAAQGNRVETNRLTAEEVDIFDRVAALLRERRAALLSGRGVSEKHVPEPLAEAPYAAFEAPSALPVRPIEVPDVPDTQDAEDEEMLEEEVVPDDPLPVPPEPQMPAPDLPSDIVVLRILEDVPPFAGPGRDYHLKKEDLVCLPPLIAKALVARKKAAMVQMTRH